MKYKCSKCGETEEICACAREKIKELETKKAIKDLVIARIKTMPSNFRLSIG